MSDKTTFDRVVLGNLVLPDGTIVNDGWMGIRDGRIAAVSHDRLTAPDLVDASGLLVLPGFVDAHVHTRSSVDEGITAATRAAAAGGTTTAIDMPFDRPARPVNTAERLQAKIADVNAEAIVDVALYATFPPEGDLSVIREMADAGAVGFKVSTIEVDPVRFPRIPDGRLYEAFQEIAATGLPVAAHQENQDIIVSETTRLQVTGTNVAIDHARSRPPVAEAEAAGRLLELAYWTTVHLHMVHGTIARTFELIEWNRQLGVLATGETCIQYLILTQEALRVMGGRAKCNPPLRREEDVAGLWEMIEDGIIDIVTSDHSPYLLSQKETSNIFDAYAGLPGAETLGTLLYDAGVASGRIGVGRFLELVASGPADIFGLASKGRLALGCDADFVVFDPDKDWTIDENELHYAVGWSPYHGRSVRGRVLSTWVRGNCVYRDGTIAGQPGVGRFVRPTS